MLISYSFPLQPFRKKWEVLIHLFSIENSIYHVTAEKSHLYFVPHMAVNVLVLMNVLENVRRCRSVRQFQLIENFLLYFQFVPFLEILYRNVVDNSTHFIECVFIHDVGLHILFF